jgi:hypothetical protein
MVVCFPNEDLLAVGGCLSVCPISGLWISRGRPLLRAGLGTSLPCLGVALALGQAGWWGMRGGGWGCAGLCLLKSAG